MGAGGSIVDAFGESRWMGAVENTRRLVSRSCRLEGLLGRRGENGEARRRRDEMKRRNDESEC